MKKDESRPARTGSANSTGPSLQDSTGRLNANEPFVYARLTRGDRDEEARRLEETREARRQQLARLGLRSRDHSDDLTTARANAAVDLTRGHWTPSDEDWLRQVVQRVGSRGVFAAETDPVEPARGEAA